MAPPRLFRVVLVMIALMSPSAGQATRRALLISISRYDHLDHLDNTPKDIELIRQRLEYDYKISIIDDRNAARTPFLVKFAAFVASIEPKDDVVIYYSGHGVDAEGTDLLVQKDSPGPDEITDNRASLRNILIPVRDLMRQISDRDPHIQVWILDACRSDPFAIGGRGAVEKGGLSEIEGLEKTFVIYSAGYNQEAQDRLPGEGERPVRGSPFSRTFAAMYPKYRGRLIQEYELELRDRVQQMVLPKLQTSSYEDQAPGRWCFSTCLPSVDTQVLVDEVHRSDQLLKELYLPLSAELQLSDQEWTAFTQRFLDLFGRRSPVYYRPTARVQGVNAVVPMTDAEWREWMTAVTAVFKPRNEKIAAIIESHPEALQKSDLATCLLRFQRHYAAFNQSLRQAQSHPETRTWDPNFPWPSCLNTDLIANKIVELEARHSKLLALVQNH